MNFFCALLVNIFLFGILGVAASVLNKAIKNEDIGGNTSNSINQNDHSVDNFKSSKNKRSNDQNSAQKVNEMPTFEQVQNMLKSNEVNPKLDFIKVTPELVRMHEVGKRSLDTNELQEIYKRNEMNKINIEDDTFATLLKMNEAGKRNSKKTELANLLDLIDTAKRNVDAELAALMRMNEAGKRNEGMDTLLRMREAGKRRESNDALIEKKEDEKRNVYNTGLPILMKMKEVGKRNGLGEAGKRFYPNSDIATLMRMHAAGKRYSKRIHPRRYKKPIQAVKKFGLSSENPTKGIDNAPVKFHVVEEGCNEEKNAQRDATNGEQILKTNDILENEKGDKTKNYTEQSQMQDTHEHRGVNFWERNFGYDRRKRSIDWDDYFGFDKRKRLENGQENKRKLNALENKRSSEMMKKVSNPAVSEWMKQLYLRQLISSLQIDHNDRATDTNGHMFKRLVQPETPVYKGKGITLYCILFFFIYS